MPPGQAAPVTDRHPGRGTRVRSRSASGGISRATSRKRGVRPSKRRASSAQAGTGQVTGDGSRLGRVARGEPVEAIRLQRGQLELLADVGVIDHDRDLTGVPGRVGRRIPGRARAPGRATCAAEEGPPGSRLDRPERPAQAVGDLGLGQLVAVGEQEDLALGRTASRPARRAASRAARRRPAPPRAPDRARRRRRPPRRATPLEGRRRRSPRRSARGDRHDRRASPGRAQAVDRPVPGDGEQPGRERPERRLRIVRLDSTRRERSPGRHLPRAPIGGQPGRRRIDGAGMPVIQRGECVLESH